MTIDGYKVVCYGVRRKPYSSSNKRPLKNVCRDCGLYSRSTMNTTKPTWRAFGFISKNKYKCKIKELWKAERMTL